MANQPKTIIFDVEMAGEDFEELDQTTQDSLTKRARSFSGLRQKQEIERVKQETSLSPLTGEVITLAIWDLEQDKGAVYYQSPRKDQSSELVMPDGYKTQVLSEAEILIRFWSQVLLADRVVSFAGRTLDIPYLMIRSAIHGIRPSANLMSSSGKRPKHIDLYELLTFNRMSIKKGGLHLWARGFGIKTSKEGIDGSEVTSYYRQGRYREIAKYCAEDTRVTKELYQYWLRYLDI